MTTGHHFFLLRNRTMLSRLRVFSVGDRSVPTLMLSLLFLHWFTLPTHIVCPTLPYPPACVWTVCTERFVCCRTVQGGAKAPSTQANGAATAAGGADGDKSHQNSRSGGGSGLLASDRPDGGVGDGGGGGPGVGGEGSSRGKLDAAVGDLHQAMAGGKKGSGDGGSPRVNEAGEVDKGSGGGEGGGGDGGGGGASATGGGGGMANGGRDMVPMTVFTRGEAAQDTYNPLLFGCRSVDNYERITFIDEGAYGKVYCALNKLTGEVVALKQVRLPESGRRV